MTSIFPAIHNVSLRLIKIDFKMMKKLSYFFSFIKIQPVIFGMRFRFRRGRYVGLIPEPVKFDTKPPKTAGQQQFNRFQKSFSGCSLISRMYHKFKMLLKTVFLFKSDNIVYNLYNTKNILQEAYF